MASVEEVDAISEKHVLPSSETANEIILEHAYSEETVRVTQKEAVDISSPGSSSTEEVIEETVVNSTEPIVIEPTPKEIPTEPVQEKVKSRELKSLLDAAKESNLDTNIAYKRRSTQEPSSSQESGGKRAMRSQNPEFVAKHKKFLHKVNKFELNSDGSIQEGDMQSPKSDKDSTIFLKTPKRKKEYFDDDAVGGSSVEDKKSRKSLKVDILNINMKKDKDGFCWRCHREGILVQCETCPRGYHPRCLKQPVYNPDRWPCPECLAILQAESTKTRSPAMRDMSLEHLCELLKYAAKRMINCSGSEPFIHPVDIKAFPDYQNYVVQPMDLTTLQNNIRNNVYGSTIAFLADAKWILHNSIIFNSYQSKLTSAAKSIVKICKQEMSEIEVCSECYQNANTKKNSWFVEVCSKPHILLWAKLKGFPYWPAKAMTTNTAGLVDVRFFGAHDRAWIPIKECFLYSKKDPNTTNKNKRNNIAECIKEVDIHIEKLKEKFGEFYYAPYRTPYDPATELEQLAFMLPKYVPNVKIKSSNSALRIPKLEKFENGEEDTETKRKRSISQERINRRRSMSRSRSRASSIAGSNQGEKESMSRASSEVRSDFGDDTETLSGSKTSLISNERPEKVELYSSQDFDKFMEGYGTEDDDSMVLDTEARKNIISYDSESDDEPLNKTMNSQDTKDIKNGNDDHDDEDDKSMSEASILSRGKVRTRGGYHNVTGKVKVLGSRISDSSLKRSSTNSPIFESPAKLSRRNSDISTKSDSSRLSGISDKINRVEDFSDMLEVSLGNSSKDTAISSSATASPEKKSRPEFISSVNKADLGKLKPVIQVNTGDLYTKNKEFRISPQNKSVSIADRLMKKITESELTSEVEKIESVKKQILDSLESSSSNKNKDDSQNNEDVSSSDNTVVKKTKTDISSLEKKEAEVNKETSNNKESYINTNTTDKNENVSSSSESTNHEPDKTKEVTKETKEVSKETKEVSKETKEVNNETKNKATTSIEKVVDPPEEPMKTDFIQKDTKNAEKEKTLTTEPPLKANHKEKDLLEENSQKEKEKEKELSVETPAKDKEKVSPLTERRDSLKPVTEKEKQTGTIEDNEMDSDEEEETSDEEESDEEFPLAIPSPKNKINKTQVKLVNVSDIISGKINTNTTEKSKTEPSSTSLKSKPAEPTSILSESTSILSESIEIKSEPASEDEDEADLNKKDKPLYDVTLTVVDKQKKIKVDENIEPGKPGFKIVDNMTRIIDSVASNFSKDFDKVPKTPPISINRKEITLKPISKLIMSPKQKARKSFPNSPHKMQQLLPLPSVKKIVPSEKKELPPKPPLNVSLKVVPALQYITSQNSTSTSAITTTSTTTVTSKDSMVCIAPKPTLGMNNLALLPPNQPMTLTQNVTGSPILAMVHSGVNTSSLIIQQNPSLPTTSQIVTQNNSQSAIVTPSIDTCTSTTSLFPQPQASEQISQPIVSDAGTLPESISKAVGDLLCKPPPRLKPRPPGPLTTYYDEGSPSSAGPTTNLINSISHRLTDYFRGLLKETLNDLTSIGDPESKIRSLELELETLKHKHSEEMLELRKNISSILKDIQKSIVEEKAKIVDETRAACEAERLRCVEEAKSKQWCAFCFKEAQFYCCWNTSYCDYPCQQKHWATHMKTCSQTTVRNIPPVANNSPALTNEKSAANAVNKPKQTYTNNKTVLKSARMIVKQTNKQGLPMYVPVQRPLQGGQQTITLVESTPGNFEIVGNHGPISLGGKLVPTTTIKVKPGNLITVASTSSNTTSTTGSGAQKTIILQKAQLSNKSTSENKT